MSPKPLFAVSALGAAPLAGRTLSGLRDHSLPVSRPHHLGSGAGRRRSLHGLFKPTGRSGRRPAVWSRGRFGYRLEGPSWSSRKSTTMRKSGPSSADAHLSGLQPVHTAPLPTLCPAPSHSDRTGNSMTTRDYLSAATGCSNAVLLERAGQGNQLAWHQLIGRYDGLVRSVAGSFRLQPADVSDVAQNTCFAWCST